MKLFSGSQRRIEKKTAYGLLGANLVFPGLGSILGGRKSGYIQLLLSLTSLAATLHYGIKLAKWIFERREQIPDWLYNLPPDVQSQLWNMLLPIIYALSIFSFALIWSLITNISIFKQAKKYSGKSGAE
jgi:hypothetical protein